MSQKASKQNLVQRSQTALYEEGKSRTQVLAHNQHQGTTNTCVEHSIVNALGLLNISVTLKEVQDKEEALQKKAGDNLLEKALATLRFGVFDGPNTASQQEALLNSVFPQVRASARLITDPAQLISILKNKNQVAILTIYVPYQQKIVFEVFDASTRQWIRSVNFESKSFPSTAYHAVTLVGYDPALLAGEKGKRLAPWCLANSWTNKPELFCLSEEDLQLAIGSTGVMLKNAVLITKK